VRIRFQGPTGRACPVRQACTQATDAPRQLTVRPQAQHEAIQAARQRQETAEFTAQYARRAGIEGTQSQAIRRGGVRRCRDIGHAKTRLQHVLTATALNLVPSQTAHVQSNLWLVSQFGVQGSCQAQQVAIEGLGVCR
jgi:transposase